MAARQLPAGVVNVVTDMQARLDDLPPGSRLREFLAVWSRR